MSPRNPETVDDIVREPILTNAVIGGGMQAQKNPDSVKAGGYIVVGGLVLQLLYFGFFIVVAFNFHLRVNKAVVPSETKEFAAWKKNLSVLYLTSFLILIRSIYRTIEYAGGMDGYLMHHEAYFYIFDAALMTIVVAAYAFFPPAELGNHHRQEQGEELRSLEGGYRSDEQK